MQLQGVQHTFWSVFTSMPDSVPPSCPVFAQGMHAVGDLLLHGAMHCQEMPYPVCVCLHKACML